MKEVFGDIWLDFTLTPVEEFTGSVEGMFVFHGGDGLTFNDMELFSFSGVARSKRAASRGFA